MKHNVLYIDDENNNLISFKLQFKEYYNIFTSLSAKDGFEILKRNNIDVIIADQLMPEMTGVEFFEQVHKEFPHIPRFILTGFRDTETVIDGINKGKISHYLQKPLNKTLLKMAISNALKSTKLLKKNVQLAKDLKIANRNLKTHNKQLKISAKRLSNAQALAHIGNWELDHSKNKLNWSDEIYRIFGLDPKKIKATYDAFLDNIHPDDREMVDKAFTKSLKTKKPYEIIHRLKLKDRTIKYVNQKCTTEFDKNGKPLFSYGTIQDITKHRKAEIALRKNERNLQLIHNTIGEVLFQIQVEPNDRFTFLSVNNAFLTAIGITEEQVIGKTIEEFIPEPSLKLVLENYKTAIQEKRVVKWEETTVYPFGKKIGNVTISPAFDEDGNCTHLIGTIHDITERKKSEEEIRKLNKDLEKKVIKGTEKLMQEKNFSNTIINSLPGIFSLFDKDENRVRWNKNHEKVTGYSPEEYMHMKTFDLFSESNKKLIKTAFSHFHEKNIITVEADLLTKIGKKIPYFFTGINVTINNEKYIAVMGIDISERKFAEAEFRKKTKELEIFNNAMIDRELRIIEMKEEVNKLSQQLGLKPVYPEVWKSKQ